ncbi:hypothetical protein GlitD10_1290 [Gloeomargarita lithophora Alchichica-D10]|uniref:Uncharacterized protein n=1 Tax=Gloeomargarita lithophora Alchichica-D10 TaxID=1188229 RepID=A0A1J0ACG9_9CYAN|nr:YaaW family protein [Gloeomargarita lithophora]APB33611.1 hypothetical protein GlitD10_1290 [Gloeomargarita lithophora Alchichica-D10]
MADDLRAVLELATVEDLEDLTRILFRRRLNPLDYLCTPTPETVQAQERQGWLDTLEARLRFLAADGMTVLQGRAGQMSYHQILVQVCHYLKLPCGEGWSVLDLESEIFLHVLQRSWEKLPAHKRQELQDQLAQELTGPWQREALQMFLQKGSVVAVGSVLRVVLIRKLAGYTAAVHLTRTALVQGARLVAVRGATAFLGPVLWGWFLAELSWSTIATNYTRVIPAVLTLAQIRLLRDESLTWAPA